MTEAEKVARELQVEYHLGGLTELGVRETFAFQEKTLLIRFRDAALSERFDVASEIVEPWRDSVWVKHSGERQVLYDRRAFHSASRDA